MTRHKKPKNHTCEDADRDLLPAALDLPCEACEDDEKERERAAYRYTGHKTTKPPRASAWTEWRAQTRELMRQNGVTETYYWAAVAVLIAVTTGLTLLVVWWLFL